MTSGAIFRRTTVRCTVLAYHAIGDCPPADDVHNLFIAPDVFRWQMQFLARRRRVVALSEVVAGNVPPGPPAVALTFDDGYVSLLSEAAPVLVGHQFPATVFVPTAYVGDRNRWDPPSSCPLAIMSPSALREAETFGIAVESHGHAHLDLTAASEPEIESDLAASVAALRTITGRQPRYLAYPFRTGSAAAQRAAEAAGFEAAFSIDLPAAGPLARPRVQVTPLDSMATFALKTSGWYMALRHQPLMDALLRTSGPLRKALRRR